MDRIELLKAFVAVVSEGSFTAAAEALSISPQLVSKYVSQLESHLGSRLLNRTTRQVSVTEAGTACYTRAQQILSDMDELEGQLGQWQSSASGVLRISAPVSFAISHLAEALVAFQDQFPDVKVDLQLSDHKVDLVESGFDVALRIGKLKSSSLIAKPLAKIRLLTCASPDYLAKHGTPAHPDDLVHHKYLHYSYSSMEATIARTGPKHLVSSPIVANNGDVLLQAAIAGAGIVVQPTFIAGSAVQAGQLVPILCDYEPESLGLYAVYANRQWLSNKVRVFLDFMDGYFGEPPYWDQGLDS